MQKIFDFHYHLLFKHYLSKKPALDREITVGGIAGMLNDLLGGPFDSQSSPAQVKKSQLFLGVIGILSVEYAFAERILKVIGFDLAKKLGLDLDIINATKNGTTSYYDEFKKQVDYHIASQNELRDSFHIEYLYRKDFENKTIAEIKNKLAEKDDNRWMCFSMEGGHNLSNVPVHSPTTMSRSPELQLKEIQDSSQLDFISMNLCHLSEIPEQHLGTFSQGLNSLSQIAFHSEDFMPKSGLGISPLGKNVIRQALTHPDKPILIDVKHMSLYSRLHYYRIRERLIQEQPETERLPIISSHSGFTFISAQKFISEKLFRSYTDTEAGAPISIINPINRKIGRTDDHINKSLYCNPWTINLFDEDIIEIMESRGMIGISMDQRILGASNPGIDSMRDKYFQKENVSRQEWEKFFRDGLFPTEEKLSLAGIAPRPAERHIMLFCLHIVYAVRLGLKYIAWTEGRSPWNCICVGTDYDGLINPVNGFENATKLEKLPVQLKKYLPKADKYLSMEDIADKDQPALKYNPAGEIDETYLDHVINIFLYDNGLNFICRFLSNWHL